MKMINTFETDDMITKKPTLEEYQKAKEEYSTYCSWVNLARKRKNQLIDDLAIERQNELLYLKQAEKQHDIIRCYEIYEQIEKSRETNA